MLIECTNCSERNYEIHLLSITITSKLWNTIECCRGFEDMKDEISTSLKTSDIFGLTFC